MILGALLIDLIVGDPPYVPHPVIYMGKLINLLEDFLYPPEGSNLNKVFRGGLLVFIVICTVFAGSWVLLRLLAALHPILKTLASIWLISTTIAVKGLGEAGSRIRQLLVNKKIQEARKEVGLIVGRDTHNLDGKEIIRATVETIAENVVDAVTSPLLFAMLGGAPLALVYRAVNTMDSMLGYKNEKYLYFGKVAARVDDLFNLIPARLTGLVIVLISLILPGCSGVNSFKILRRDARRHPSPNSGFAESAVSGATGVQLGGLNYYQGIPSNRPHIGENITPLSTQSIKQTVGILYITALVWSCLLELINWFI
ncbi:MAG: adenosylcobinamide-phosphate synthase CbiB [Peptococcaceae bacterium]